MTAPNSAKKALDRACKLSKVDGANIMVLYVIPRYEEMIEFFRTDSIQQSLFDEAEKIMGEAKKIALPYEVSIAATIQEGHAADKIVEIADKLKNDLIIIGTYGWKGVNKAIMGSTTERVIMNAKSPVLVVR